MVLKFYGLLTCCRRRKKNEAVAPQQPHPSKKLNVIGKISVRTTYHGVTDVSGRSLLVCPGESGSQDPSCMRILRVSIRALSDTLLFMVCSIRIWRFEMHDGIESRNVKQAAGMRTSATVVRMVLYSLSGRAIDKLKQSLDFGRDGVPSGEDGVRYG